MSKDIFSNCSLQMHRNEDIFDDCGCVDCDDRIEDDDDLMSIFNMAEIWFSDGKDEDYS